MAAREGFIVRALRRMRKALDEPETNAKYSDSEMIEFLELAVTHILGEINRNTQHPYGTFYEITLGANTADQIFMLPPGVGHILWAKLIDTDGNVVGLLDGPAVQNPTECLWELHGNMLRVPKYAYTANYVIRFKYAPFCTARLHYGNAADTLHETTATTFTLASSPTAGTLDARPNAYASSILRILGADTNDEAQERVIKSYDPSTRIATLWSALDPVPTGTVTYEIAPPFDAVVDMTASLVAVRTLASIEGQFRRRRAINDELKLVLRDLRLDKANYDSIQGTHFDEEAAVGAT